MSHHPLVERAAAGELPEWSEASLPRRRHMARVADLLGQWSGSLALDESECVRWRAAGYLHDLLRDADPERLRAGVPPTMSALPGQLLHGPAAAERLRADGVTDGELLRAVAYHTLGHPELGRLGRALYAADFLEPGRDLLNDWRASLRARMPGALDDVVREVLGARIAHIVDRRGALRAETTAFWNVLAEGE